MGNLLVESEDDALHFDLNLINGPRIWRAGKSRDRPRKFRVILLRRNTNAFSVLRDVSVGKK